jgi:predicted TIM-barrel fold metal-dependent hydrolase
VFIECRASYRVDGPDYLRPVGETEYVVANEADRQVRFPQAPPIAGIVAHTDLTLDPSVLDETLDAHAEAAEGRLRGIRDALSSCSDPALTIPGRYTPGKYKNEAFLAGVRRLGQRGLTYDSWHFHWQNTELAAVARACPETQVVLNHFGVPLGVGPWADRRDEVLEVWKAGLAEAAACENVVAKLGGMAMPDNGYGWHEAERPPTSDAFVEAQAWAYHHTIEAFGPDRCMFESNFPVDKQSIGYRVLWNGFKKLSAGYSDDERAALFSGTARRIYRL